MGIGSYDYRGQEVSLPAVCELENHASCCDSVLVQRPENWGADGVNPCLNPTVREPGAPMPEGR